MKKIFLLIVVAASLAVSSCSNDDDSRDSSVLKITVDGIQNTYNTVIVEQENRVHGDRAVNVLTITAFSSKNQQDYISFSLNESDLGSSSVLYYFEYITAGKYFEGLYDQPGQFSFVVNQNSHRILKGAFSGKVITTQESTAEEKHIEGFFSIYF